MTSTPGPAGQILLYRIEDGRARLDVRIENDTVWLNHRQFTELLGKAKGTISEHVKHIVEDGEFEPEVTVQLFTERRLHDLEALPHAARQAAVGDPTR